MFAEVRAEAPDVSLNLGVLKKSMRLEVVALALAAFAQSENGIKSEFTLSSCKVRKMVSLNWKSNCTAMKFTHPESGKNSSLNNRSQELYRLSCRPGLR